MIRLKIGLDWDDVIAPFNSLAIEMANEQYKPEVPYRLEEITSWENTGRTSIIKEFYHSSELYSRQTKRISNKSIEIVRRLMEIADVYIITAAYPEFMGTRAAQIMTVFPELPHDRIILGAAKHLVKFDVVLDDNFCNVLESPSQYAVLMRKPWNQKMTGLPSVNTLEEFYWLIKRILFLGTDVRAYISAPHVVAIVGPSGSNKNAIADQLLKDSSYKKLRSYTTKENSKTHVYVTEEEFLKKVDEHTMYGGYRYGVSYEDVRYVLEDEKRNVVMPLDVCGAISMSGLFPTIIVYAKRRKDELILEIVSDGTLSDDEKTLRLLSINAEQKNQSLCDMVVDARDAEKAANQIMNLK